MSLVISALAFLVLLTVLVIIHELGHYLMARKAGVAVEEFGFGLPPRALTLFRSGPTRFTLNWIPFGGFIRMKGDNLTDEHERRRSGTFAGASIPARILILIAGVVMNFLFAILLFAVGFSVGRWVPTYLTYEDMQAAAARGVIHMEPTVLIERVLPGGAAEKAGVPAQSIIKTIDKTDITSPEQVSPLLAGKGRVTLVLLTGTGFTEEVRLAVPVKAGRMGVEIRAFPKDLGAPVRGPFQALALSFRETGVVTVQTVLGMEQLIVSLVSRATVPEGITGIVGIAELTHLSVQQGFMTYLRLVALLSLSLAVLNILPLPALDGGRLLFVLFEAVRRRPANVRVETTTNFVGFLVLIALILIITYHDILRFFL